MVLAVERAKTIFKVNIYTLWALAGIICLPATALSETYQKIVKVTQASVDLPMEAYEQQALARLQSKILDDHVTFKLQWPSQVLDEHKKWLIPEIKKQFDVNIDVSEILLKAKYKDADDYLFEYTYKIDQSKIYTVKGDYILNRINAIAADATYPGYARLELELAYPNLINKGNGWAGWNSRFNSYSSYALKKLPIDSYEVIASTARVLSSDELDFELEALFTLYDYAPFNAYICTEMHTKLDTQLPKLAELILSSCPKVNLQTGMVTKGSKEKQKDNQLYDELKRLTKATGLLLDEVPLLTFILAFNGNYPLELPQNREVSFEDLLDDQGFVYNIINVEKNFSVNRLSSLKDSMYENNYHFIAKIIETQIKNVY